jgi:hypothetical protein
MEICMKKTLTVLALSATQAAPVANVPIEAYKD